MRDKTVFCNNLYQKILIFEKIWYNLWKHFSVFLEGKNAEIFHSFCPPRRSTKKHSQFFLMRPEKAFFSVWRCTPTEKYLFFVFYVFFQNRWEFIVLTQIFGDFGTGLGSWLPGVGTGSWVPILTDPESRRDRDSQSRPIPSRDAILIQIPTGIGIAIFPSRSNTTLNRTQLISQHSTLIIALRCKKKWKKVKSTILYSDPTVWSFSR